jgi:hypothetical protein
VYCVAWLAYKENVQYLSFHVTEISHSPELPLTSDDEVTEYNYNGNKKVNKRRFLSIANASHLKYGRIKDKYISKTSGYPNRPRTWWSMYTKPLATH